MPRLVVLSEGLTGRTHELKAERTTIGRMEDNSFQVPDPSVSSHHCEVVLKGNELFFHDLGSTNGSFVNGERVMEATLKPSQVIRLGQVDVRFEGDSPSSQKRTFDHTQIVPQGIKVGEISSTPQQQTSNSFKPKSNTSVWIFWAVIGVIALCVIGWLVFTVMGVGGGGGN